MSVHDAMNKLEPLTERKERCLPVLRGKIGWDLFVDQGSQGFGRCGDTFRANRPVLHLRSLRLKESNGKWLYTTSCLHTIAS